VIIWTFNPTSMPNRSLIRLRRSEMWMSREAFLQRYGKHESPLHPADKPGLQAHER
jgi:hypothetical protein